MEAMNQPNSYSEMDGELMQFWTGNPSNDIQHGHVLLREIECTVKH